MLGFFFPEIFCHCTFCKCLFMWKVLFLLSYISRTDCLQPKKPPKPLKSPWPGVPQGPHVGGSKKEEQQQQFSSFVVRMGLTQFPGILGQSSTTTAFHVSAVRGVCPTHFSGDLASAKVWLVLEKWGALKEHTHTPVGTANPRESCPGVDAPGKQGWEGYNWFRGPMNSLWNVVFFFFPWASRSPSVQNRKEGQGKERQHISQPASF